MTIIKNTFVDSIHIEMSVTNPSIRIKYVTTIDDPDDDDLPITSEKFVQLNRYSTIGADEEGIPINGPTDISAHPQIVQDIAALIWTD